MIKALESTLGVVTSACKAVGIERTSHYKWMNNDEEYRRQVEDIENIAIDFVETKLLNNIANGDTSASIFYLKTKGKKRGYVEKYDVDMNANIKGELTIDDFIKSRFKE